MIERGNGGSIVMMSSYLAFRAMEIRSVYCCTKAALDQLTRSLAMELGPHKVSIVEFYFVPIEVHAYINIISECQKKITYMYLILFVMPFSTRGDQLIHELSG